MTPAPGRPSPSSFRFAEEDGLAAITLSRPERLNALTFQVYEELTALFESFRARDDLRVVTITGEGRAFCSGGDVEDIIGRLLEMDEAGLRRFTRLTCDLILAMRRAPQPVVASLNGTVAGAGAVIALASDLRIATRDAKIAFLFVKVGLAGADMGAAWLLPRLIGHSRATEALFLGDFIDPAAAYAIGLYHRLVDRDQLDEATEAAVRRLKAGPPRALAATKDALNREWSLDLETALAHEADVQARLMMEADFREGYAAFSARRPPAFGAKGRA